MSSVSEWDDTYAALARVCSQQRANRNTAAASSDSTTVAALTQQLERLQQQLAPLQTYLTPAEYTRRRNLIQHLLQQQQNYSANSNNSSSFSALQQQDDMIDELSKGVGRLKQQTVLVSDEAIMHVNLLNDMEQNIDQAQYGLEGETRRAELLRESKSVWRLQLIVVGLSVLLVLLILMGLS